jgi:ATPase subunit of ABC transporter with duplicated ATPase domains
MKGLGQGPSPDHVVLKDIWLSFLPAPRSACSGLNGAGKSTLLKIMAARTPSSSAKPSSRRAAPPATCRRSRRSIHQDRPRESSTRASPRRAALLVRFDEINAKFGEDLSPEEMDKVLEEQGKVQDRIDARTPGTSIRSSSSRWTRCAARRPTRR